MIIDYGGGGTDRANRQVNCSIPAKLLYAARYQNRYMDRESADRTGRPIDRFIESETIVSGGFVTSTRKVLGYARMLASTIKPENVSCVLI